MDNIQKIQTVQYSKIDDNTLQVITPQPQPEPTVQTYDRTFIENQIVAIQKQKDDFDALRDAEIQNCQDILSQMDALNITAKPDTSTPNVAPSDVPLENNSEQVAK